MYNVTVTLLLYVASNPGHCSNFMINDVVYDATLDSDVYIYLRHSDSALG